jgi:hypothetical protein
LVPCFGGEKQPPELGSGPEQRLALRQPPTAVEQQLFAVERALLCLAGNARCRYLVELPEEAIGLARFIDFEDAAGALPQHDAVMRIGARFTDDRHDLDSRIVIGRREIMPRFDRPVGAKEEKPIIGH